MSTLNSSEPRAQQSDLSQAEQSQTELDQIPEKIQSSLDQISNLPSSLPFPYNGSLHSPNTLASEAHPAIASPGISPSLSTRLQLQTNHIEEQKKRQELAVGPTSNTIVAEAPQQTVFNAGLPVRSSSMRSIFGSRNRRSDSLSPASAISSPGLGPLADMTPLPSPVSAWGTSGFGRSSIESDLDPEATVAGQTRDSPPEPIAFSRTSPKKKRIPDNHEQIYNANAAAHARNRSLSEYVPEGMQIPRSRNIVVSTSGAPPIGQSSFSPLDDDHMRREQYLAMQRGLAILIPKPPTPPESNEGKDGDGRESSPTTPGALQGALPLVYEAYMVEGGKLRKWRALRELGKGTFSTVMLATSEQLNNIEASVDQTAVEDLVSPKPLVAVKICEQGPAGGADEKKIETSIKREMEIMKSINHPSLVHLIAFNTCERQTFLVLNYCPGGDLFELANSELDILTPSLIRRMFSELVSAVRCLHEQYIVHRDIKLESRCCVHKGCALGYANSRSRCPCQSTNSCLLCDEQLAIIFKAGCDFDRSWSRTLDTPTAQFATPRYQVRK